MQRITFRDCARLAICWGISVVLVTIACAEIPTAVEESAKSVCKLDVPKLNSNRTRYGSGTYIGNRMVVSCSHIIYEPDEDGPVQAVTHCTFPDGQSIQGECVLRIRGDVSLIVLDHEPAGMKAVQLASEDPVLGETIWTVGYPGELQRAHTIKQHTVSNVEAWWGRSTEGPPTTLNATPDEGFTTTQQGDSGGGCFNESGQLIGPAYAHDELDSSINKLWRTQLILSRYLGEPPPAPEDPDEVPEPPALYEPSVMLEATRTNAANIAAMADVATELLASLRVFETDISSSRAEIASIVKTMNKQDAAWRAQKDRISKVADQVTGMETSLTSEIHGVGERISEAERMQANTQGNIENLYAGISPEQLQAKLDPVYVGKQISWVVFVVGAVVSLVLGFFMVVIFRYIAPKTDKMSNVMSRRLAAAGVLVAVLAASPAYCCAAEDSEEAAPNVGAARPDSKQSDIEQKPAAPEPESADTQPEAPEPGDSVAPAHADALQTLNAQRAQRGLYALKLDPELQRLAEERLALNVQRGSWRHYTRGRGRFIGPVPSGAFREGVGYTPGPGQISVSHWDSSRETHAGIAMTQVGNRYWQLALFKRLDDNSAPITRRQEIGQQQTYDVPRKQKRLCNECKDCRPLRLLRRFRMFRRSRSAQE